MADLAITIQNYFPFYGMEETNKWGTAVWGVNKWGYGDQDLPTDVGKLIENSQASDTSEIIKSIGKLISESEPITSDVSKDVVRDVITNDFLLTNGASSETIGDGSGYKYVFVSDTVEAEERDFVTYAAASTGTVSYTCAAAAVTTWS